MYRFSCSNPSRLQETRARTHTYGHTRARAHTHRGAAPSEAIEKRPSWRFDLESAPELKVAAAAVNEA